MKIFIAIAVLALGAVCAAQEVLYVDLVGVTQRTELRHPPAPPCEIEPGPGIGPCVPGASIGGGVGDGGEDYRDPRALRVSVTSLNAISYSQGDPIEIEFKLENAGTVPYEVPVYPHLSDLQPADISQKFTYRVLSLELKQNLTKPLVLFGNAEHPGTLVLLKPGEWIRVRGRAQFAMSDKQWAQAYKEGARLVEAGFWLANTTFTPKPGGWSTISMNLYPRHLSGPGMMIRFEPTAAKAAK